VLVLLLACRSNNIALGDALLKRLARLQVIFIGVGLYFVLIHHMTNYYFTRNRDFECFILFDGGIYTNLFWFGQILLGTLVPVGLLLHPRIAQMRARIVASVALVVLGAFAQLYVTILGDQAQPMPLFPGRQVSSSFFDGVVNSYTPSLPEWGLGLLGLAMVGLIVTLALRLIAFLPQRLDDSALQKYRAKQALAGS
jgi:molybdopterin-containing oxidoreductase family membrane subunit